MSWFGDVLKKAIPAAASFIPGVGAIAGPATYAMMNKGEASDPYNMSGKGGGGGGWKDAGSYDKGGGSGMGWEDWLQIGTGAAGALAGGWGAYKEGQARERDYTAGRDDEMFYRGRDEDRYQEMRGDMDYNREFEREKYDTGRADIQYGRDFRDMSAAALRPEVDWLKNRRYS
jgi:hypothetical protein